MEKKETIFNGKIDKIERYDWDPIQDSPGTLKWIKKEKLEVDKSYQRIHILKKAQDLAAKFSWVGCGVITVSKLQSINGGLRNRFKFKEEVIPE